MAEFGTAGFDYSATAGKDLFVWQAARRAMVVGSPTYIDQAPRPLIQLWIGCLKLTAGRLGVRFRPFAFTSG